MRLLQDTQAVSRLCSLIERGGGPLELSGLTESAAAALVSGLELERWRLLLVRDESQGKQFLRDVRSFEENSWYYPARDLLFYQADTQGTLVNRQRVEVLRHLMEDGQGLLITTIDALMDKLLNREGLKREVLNLVPGMELPLESLCEHLSRMGYEHTSQVDGMGQFAVRGGIVDVYPFTEEEPVRIEFWDRELDNLRSFDLESQRSLEAVEQLAIYPVTDRREPGGEGTEVSLLDYLPADVLCALWEPERLKERAAAVEQEFMERLLKRSERAEAALTAAGFADEPEADGGEADDRPPEDVRAASEGLIYSAESVLARLNGPRTLCLSALEGRQGLISCRERFWLECASPVKYKASMELLYKDLGRWQREGARIVIFSASKSRASRLALELREQGLRAYCPDIHGLDSPEQPKGRDSLDGSEQPKGRDSLDGSEQPKGRDSLDGSEQPKGRDSLDGSEQPKGHDRRGSSEAAGAPAAAALSRQPGGEIQVRTGYLHTGFICASEQLVVLTESDMFGNIGELKKKRRQKKYDGSKISRLSEIKPGDYVVHESHGIGIYKGIERIETDGVEKDYIQIEYGDGGKLYLPATKLEGIQKYGSADGAKPRLNRLNGAEWQKTRTRVQKAVREMARELVLLYAERRAQKGFVYSPDSVWQREFEDMFPYDETTDQLLAIEATKADMESRKIMDRLICGDVGYGKTEIALRAAFKAVQDSKQVAYLVPTTILAEQIYNTFEERMKGFPVKLALLCRFRTPAQIKQSLAQLRRGTVDIVIGTHRLLSKDVQYKDLGLLIIDEEQRFGVADKEKLKQLRKDVDVLTLTATPIPRTLHMSLAGIRDMSVLEEAPIDRLPIQTYVMEFNDELVREAIQRELARNGQVYYVHNRVNNIAEIAHHVQQLCPQAVVAYAHGQMSEKELEKIMLSFIHGEIDVLVSTTIIETGLDIPNANTMIIADADRMGLSQLYQLRGRVGRSRRTAYAFLMYRRGKLLREESEKRLKAIREFTQLGSGIKIAMRDLEIRGAGNVLGAEQHGHMEAVGYDLYCKLLNQAVRALQGGGEEPLEPQDFETSVDAELDAFLPDSYIADEQHKLDAYKRISLIERQEDYMDMLDELTDRFGELPRPAENLLRIALLKALGHSCGVTELKLEKERFRIQFRPEAQIRNEALPGLIQEMRGALRVLPGATPGLLYQSRDRRGAGIENSMQLCEQVLKRLQNG